MMTPTRAAIVLTLAVTISLFAGYGRAADNPRLFVDALEAYRNGDYALAAKQWSTIADTGVKNGDLFYNLGNAYLKGEQLGPALLWYERALRLLPNDPDLRFNYDYARSLTQDAPDQDQQSLERIIFFWKYRLSPATVVYTALVCNLLFWTLIAIWRVTRLRPLRQAALIVLVPTLIFVATALFNYHESTRRRQAIVLPQQVSVRSGLEETSTELFVLHAGAKVIVVKKLDEHYQIRFSTDKIGWVKSDALGLI
jgi:tetratricopeptide (TPR) repeat protein